MRVFGQKHDPHPAAPYLAVYPVLPDLRSNVNLSHHAPLSVRVPCHRPNLDRRSLRAASAAVVDQEGPTDHPESHSDGDVHEHCLDGVARTDHPPPPATYACCLPPA